MIDIFSKCAWVLPLKGKKDIRITNSFQNFLNEPNHKPNKIWVDKGSEYNSRLMKLRLQDNDVEMYSIHMKGKSVVAEWFNRTLKNNNYKYMTSVSKNVYIDKLDEIVNK